MIKYTKHGSDQSKTTLNLNYVFPKMHMIRLLLSVYKFVCPLASLPRWYFFHITPDTHTSNVLSHSCSQEEGLCICYVVFCWPLTV